MNQINLYFNNLDETNYLKWSVLRKKIFLKNFNIFLINKIKELPENESRQLSDKNILTVVRLYFHNIDNEDPLKIRISTKNYEIIPRFDKNFVNDFYQFVFTYANLQTKTLKKYINPEKNKYFHDEDNYLHFSLCDKLEFFKKITNDWFQYNIFHPNDVRVDENFIWSIFQNISPRMKIDNTIKETFLKDFFDYIKDDYLYKVIVDDPHTYTLRMEILKKENLFYV